MHFRLSLLLCAVFFTNSRAGFPPWGKRFGSHCSQGQKLFTVIQFKRGPHNVYLPRCAPFEDANYVKGCRWSKSCIESPAWGKDFGRRAYAAGFRIFPESQNHFHVYCCRSLGHVFEDCEWKWVSHKSHAVEHYVPDLAHQPDLVIRDIRPEVGSLPRLYFLAEICRVRLELALAEEEDPQPPSAGEESARAPPPINGPVLPVPRALEEVTNNFTQWAGYQPPPPPPPKPSEYSGGDASDEAYLQYK